MTQTPPETRDYGLGPEPPRSKWVTDEAALLDRISDQLAGIQASLDRLELGAAEFVPAVRSLLGKRLTKAAASAADLFRRP